MPKNIGAPLTFTNVQPKREVTNFTVFVAYDAAGIPHLSAIGNGLIRVRDGSGNVIYTDPAGEQAIGMYQDGQITGTLRTSFLSAITTLDAQ